jgi:hypothetical protein
LGLGLPWVIATLWSANFVIPEGDWTDGHKEKWTARFGADSPVPNVGDALTEYYVPAGSLGFSVVVFIIVACVCFITLLARRKVLGGELGGSSTGRLLSCIFLCFLWFIYIVMSTL